MRMIKWKTAIVLFVLTAIGAVNAQTHFVFTGNTGNNATVGVPLSANPSLDGVPLSRGDEIGAFTPAGLCVGAVVWDSAGTAVTVWGDNDQTAAIDGIRTGEQISYRIWKKATNTEYENVAVTYSQGDGVYAPDKIMALSSLNAVSSTGPTPTHFAFTTNTGNDATVGIPASANLEVDGIPLSNGDEIGAFTPAGLCVGAIAWNGVNTALTVWGDNDQTGSIDGIQAGQQINYRIWRKSTGIEYDVVNATYSVGDGVYSPDTLFTLSSLSSTTPSAPQLVAPFSGATGLSVAPKVSWSRVANTSGYELQISLDSNFSTVVLDSSGLADTSLVTPALRNSAEYFWRVRSANGGAQSGWSQVWSFITIVGTPAPASPANGSTGISVGPTFVWSSVYGATGYRLQVSTDSTFAITVLDTIDLADTSLVISGLKNSTKYYWRVDAASAVDTSSWSQVRSFTTTVGVPSLINPASGTTGLSTSPVVTWGSTYGATSYRLQLSTDSSFATVNYDTSGIVDTTKTITGLENWKRYYWRVEATSAGGTGGWSQFWEFTTILPMPTVPTLTIPTNGASNESLSLTLQWNSKPFVSSYHLQVATDSNFANVLVVNDSSITDTLMLLTGLTRNTLYYWRVSASNLAGTSGWSPTWSFTTTSAGEISLSFSVNMAVYTKLGLYNPSVDTVLVRGSFEHFVGMQDWSGSSFVLVPQTAGDSIYVGSWTFPDSTANDTIYFKFVIQSPSDTGAGVDTWEGGTNRSFYVTSASSQSIPVDYFSRRSEVGSTHTVTFVADMSTLIAAGFNDAFDSVFVVGDTPPLNWGPGSRMVRNSTDTSQYRLSVSITYPPGDSVQWKFWLRGIHEYSNNGWEIPTEGNTSEGNRVFLFPTQDTVLQACQPGVQILSGPTPPAVPTLGAPSNGSSGLPADPTLSWNAQASATSYRLQISADSGFSTTVYDSRGITDTTAQVTGLSYHTKYYWRVNASNLYGTSAWSLPFAFRTKSDKTVLFEDDFDAVNGWSDVTYQGDGSFSDTLFDGENCGSFYMSGSPGAFYVLKELTVPIPKGSILQAKWYYVTSGSYANSENSDGGTLKFLSAIPPTQSDISADSLLTLLIPSSYAMRQWDSVQIVVTRDIPAGSYLAIGGSVWPSYITNNWDYIRISSTNNLLSMPTLVSPANGATGIVAPPTIVWNKVPGAASYRLQLSTDSTFATVNFDSSGMVDTSLSVKGLMGSTRYFWRVNWTGALGTSDWSSAWDFITFVEPPVVTLASVSSNRLTLDWSPVLGAVKYYIYKGIDSTQIVKVDSTTGTSYMATGLSPNTVYWFAASSVDSQGRESVPGSPLKSLTRLAPSSVAVVPVKPLKISVTWTSVSGAVAYSIFRSMNGMTFSRMDSTTGLVYSDSTVSSATNYRYFILAVDQNGSYGDTSNVADTMSYPSVPTALSATPVSDWEVRLSWKPDSGSIAAYRVYRSIDSVNYAFVGTTTSATYLDTALSALTPYWYKVTAINSDSAESDPSVGMKVTTLQLSPRIVFLQKLSNAARDTLQFADSCYVPPGDSATFVFLYSLNNGMTFDTARAMVPGKASVSSSSSDILSWYTRLDAPTAESDSVILMVVPAYQQGTGTPRETARFLLDNSAPRFSGLDSSIGGPSQIRLSWKPAVDISSPVKYFVYRSNTSRSEDFAAPDTATEDTSIIIPNLNNFVRYYFVVRAQDTLGNIDTNTVERTGVPIEVPNITSITSPGVPVRGDVVVRFNVTVPNQDSLVVNCYYSPDSGSAFTPTQNFTFGLSATGGTDSIVWHSVNDFRRESRSVRFKVVPSGRGGSGPGAVTAYFTVDNQPPTFAGLRSARGGGNSASLTWQRATDLSGVSKYLVYKSETSGAENFQTPDTTTSDTSVVVTGLANFRQYYFVVRAEDSLGNLDTNLVQKSVTPADLPSITGVSVLAKPLHGDVRVSLKLNVPNQDTVHLECLFSSDSGKTYLPADSVVGRITGLTSSISETLLWHSSSSYRGESAGARFAIVPIGRGGSGDSSSTGNFILDNQPPDFTGVASETYLPWSSYQIAVAPATDMSGPVTYAYYFSSVDSFDYSRAPDSMTTADTLVVHNLPALDTIYYRVRAIDALGNEDTNTTLHALMMPAIGSYYHNNFVGTQDIGMYVNAWTTGDLAYADLYPDSGTFPQIVVKGDGILNAQDLVVLAKMYNYCLTQNMTSGRGAQASIDPTLAREKPITLNVDKSCQTAELSLSPGINQNLMSCGIRIFYGTLHLDKGTNVSVDSVHFSSGGITLTFNDTVNKVIYLDYGKIGGYNPGDKPVVTLKLSVPKFSPKDSMVVSLVGYDSQMSRVIANSYTLELNNIPTTFKLYQNYPNPFNPRTTIRFDVPKIERVTVTIYNILGQRVATLVDKEYQPGTYDISFNGFRYASGAYFCVMQAGRYHSVKKMMMIK